MKAITKYDSRLKEIFEAYKVALSSLLKSGRNDEAINLLKDGGVIGKNPKTFSDILKSSKNDRTPEEIFINRVNIVLTFLDSEEKKFILNEYMYSQGSNWYIDIYSRSTYYRIKRNAIERFLNFFDCTLK